MKRQKSEPWQTWEIELLREKYQTLTAEQIQRDFLPHRTCNAIRIIITRYNISQKTPQTSHIKSFENSHQPWTEEETKLLTEHFPNTSTVKLQQQYLPTRSVKAIERRAARMGLIRNSCRAGRQNTKPYTKRQPYAKWSEKETALLEKYKDSLTTQELHDKYLPDKTVGQIRTKIRNESIKDYIDTSWSDEEIKILNDNIGKISAREIAKLLPNRTVNAIRDKAVVLGRSARTQESYRDWSKQETDMLVKHYGAMTIAEIQAAYIPTRTVYACRNKITNLRKSGIIK